MKTYLNQSIAKWDGSESTNTYSLSINYDFLFIYIVNAVICVCIMDTFFLDTTFPIPTKFGTLNRPTRSASRALILVLYRPLSCWNSYFILSDNYKHVTYHNVRLLVQCHNVLHVPLNKPLQAIMEASNIDPKGWFAASKDEKYI